MATPTQETTELRLRLSKEAGEKLSLRASQTGRDMASVASELIEQAMATPAPPISKDDIARRLAAWDKFVSEMRKWGEENLPPGHVVDDSRETIYEGRGE